MKILVVDDEDGMRRLLSRVLTREGYETSAVGSGAEALRLVGSERFDLVVTDIKMPEMDGYEVSQAIRNTLESPKNRMPIIALTAGVMETDLKKCLDAGMNGYISKPYKATDLVFEITKVLKLKA